MKQFMFIALALLLAACEKPVLDNEDAVTKKDANVTLISSSTNRNRSPAQPPTSPNSARA